MLFDVKQRWLPTINSVTLRALPLFRPLIELILVRIWSVTIFAFGKGNFFLEVILDVASQTSDLSMFAN